VDTNIYDGLAPLLRERGYFPLPIGPGTKKPQRYVPSKEAFEGFIGWQERPAPLTTPQLGAGIGVRCGNGIVAIDYDNEDAALRVSEVLGDSPVNKAGATAWTSFFRASFPVESEDFHNDNGELMLQVLSAGRQAVIPPSVHPDTGQPYRWTNGRSLYDTAPGELPELPADYRERILALGYQSSGGKKDETDNGPHGDPSTFAGPFAEVNDLAMRNRPLWVPDLGLYNLHRERGYQVWRAVATWRPSVHGHAPEQRKRNLKICNHGINDFGGGGGKGYSPLDLVMAARGCDLGAAYDWLTERVRSTGGPEVDFDALSEPAKPQAEQPKEDKKPEKKPRILLLPYDAPDPTKIPRREWLYGFHYMRKIVSATIGPGGIGKSSLNLVEAVGMSIGLDLFDHKKPLAGGPLNVWYHNGEDPRDELNRRIAAICLHYELDEREVRQRMFVTCGLDMPIKVASGATQVRLDRPLVAEIINAIRERKLDVETFDPLVTMHNTNEQLNATMDPIIRDVFGVVANDTNSSVDLAHHARKKHPGQDEYTTADARGASSIIDAVRGARVLNEMSKTDADRFGVEETERDLHFRVSKGKVNMTRKGGGIWRCFHGVILPNGDPETGAPGDEVGVLAAWTPPDVTDILTDEDRLYFYTLVTGDPTYRTDARAAKWFGKVIAERLGFNLEKKGGRKRVEAVFGCLLDEGVLAIVERHDEQRRLREFIGPGPLPSGAFNQGV
jgi:AAA domain/Bifunctional DNA primase/polymerase, N-terminal